jgi:hypothetical protein
MPLVQGPPDSLWYSASPRIFPHRFFISSSTLLASVVGIGRGRESTEGDGDSKGEVGREVGRLVKRLLVEDGFLSLEEVDSCKSEGLYPSRGGGWRDGSLKSSTGSDPAEEKEPTRCRVSGAGAYCCRKVPSMVRVLGRKDGWRGGGLDEALSNDVPKESLNTRPCRLTGAALPGSTPTAPALGMDRGEVWGDKFPKPRGPCSCALSGASSVTSVGSGVTALTVFCAPIAGRPMAARMVPADSSLEPRGDGISVTDGRDVP